MVEIRPDAIRQELMKTVGSINELIVNVKERAKQQGIDPMQMVDQHGNFVMIPLITAQANCLHAIAALQLAKAMTLTGGKR